MISDYFIGLILGSISTLCAIQLWNHSRGSEHDGPFPLFPREKRTGWNRYHKRKMRGVRNEGYSRNGKKTTPDN
jgi:hypothetical protein